MVAPRLCLMRVSDATDGCGQHEVPRRGAGLDRGLVAAHKEEQACHASEGNKRVDGRPETRGVVDPRVVTGALDPGHGRVREQRL